MAYFSRANARFHQRDPAGYTDYLTAFRLDPSAAVTEILRIVVTDIEEGAESVLENCRKHLAIHADDAIAYDRRAMTLFVLGRESEAARDLRTGREPDSGLKASFSARAPKT